MAIMSRILSVQTLVRVIFSSHNSQLNNMFCLFIFGTKSSMFINYSINLDVMIVLCFLKKINTNY